MPETILGKWTIGLLAAFGIATLVPMAAGLMVQPGQQTFFDNLYIFGNLNLPGFLAAVFGVATFITGLISIIKFKERSVLVIVAMFVGFLVLLMVGVVIVSPEEPMEIPI